MYDVMNTTVGPNYHKENISYVPRWKLDETCFCFCVWRVYVCVYIIYMSRRDADHLPPSSADVENE
jgi:hypothetical protein